MTDTLLNMTQVADILAISHRQLQRRIAAGELGVPLIDISTSASRRVLRVRANDLSDYLKAREVSVSKES